MNITATAGGHLLPLPCHPTEIDDFLSTPSAAAVEVLSRHPGPVMILGAGGKMGLHCSLMVRRALRQLGRIDAVTAVSRFSSPGRRPRFEQMGIATLDADLSDPAAIDSLPEAATVFFLAGVKFGTSQAPQLLRQINEEMPQHIANRCKRSRIVAFSSGNVYPFMPVDSTGATEATAPAPVGDYAVSCLTRERAFARASESHGTLVTLIRLNYSVEFRYGVLVDIAQKVLRREPLDVTTGYVNVIWQRDAVDYAVRSLDMAAAPAAVLNVAGPQILSVRELAGQFGSLLGVEPNTCGQEARTALLSDPSCAVRRLGRPQTSVAEMTEWIAAWLQRGHPTLNKPTGFERRDGLF